MACNIVQSDPDKSTDRLLDVLDRSTHQEQGCFRWKHPGSPGRETPATADTDRARDMSTTEIGLVSQVDDDSCLAEVTCIFGCDRWSG